MGDYSDAILKLVEYELWCNLQAIDFLAGLSEDESKHDFGFGLLKWSRRAAGYLRR